MFELKEHINWTFRRLQFRYCYFRFEIVVLKENSKEVKLKSNITGRTTQ